MGFNSSNDILNLFLLLQLGGALAFVLVGLYVLYCFNRAASGLERMASVAEAWLALQHYQIARAKENPPQSSTVLPQEIVTIEPNSAPDNL